MKQRKVIEAGANDWLARLRLALNSGELSRSSYDLYLKWFELVVQLLMNDFNNFGSRRTLKPSVRYLTEINLERPTTIWAKLEDGDDSVRILDIVSIPEFDS